jgi:hypothetical protein
MTWYSRLTGTIARMLDRGRASTPQPRDRHGNNFIAICAIMKNEARGVLEWIAYHRVLGIDKFFLFDNKSDDGVFDLLKPLIDAGIVEYFDWPKNPGQVEAYTHYAQMYPDNYTWTAYIDLDEFINYFGDSSFRDWVSKFEDSAGIAIQWINFGPSGHDSRPAGLTISSYTHRLPDDCQVHGHVKSIVRTASFIRPITPHAFVLNGPISDEYGQPVSYRDGDYSIQPILPHREICLNHYYTRSRAEWLEKVARGMADSAENAPNRRDVTWIDHYERDATTADDRLARLSDVVEKEIAFLKNL